VGVHLVLGLPFDADGQNDDLADRGRDDGVRGFDGDELVVGLADGGTAEEDVERADEPSLRICCLDADVARPRESVAIEIVTEAGLLGGERVTVEP
jgi:hypothetical protein